MEIENPNTLCARAACRKRRSQHEHGTGACAASGCPKFVYDWDQDLEDSYRGAHGAFAQDSARRMMWGD